MVAEEAGNPQLTKLGISIIGLKELVTEEGQLVAKELCIFRTNLYFSKVFFYQRPLSFLTQNLNS